MLMKLMEKGETLFETSTEQLPQYLTNIGIEKHRMQIPVKRPTLFIIMIIAASLQLTTVYADGDKQQVVNSQQLSDTVFLITGDGGNIGVSIGKDGVFLIDDKYAPMTDDILKTIQSLGGQTPKFVINTHWHSDHTGGNENLGKQGSIIVAHENVRKRLAEDNFLTAFNTSFPASPESALPVITFPETISFHFNEDTIKIQYIANAHTDGDSIVYFTNDNILHTGDLFFNGFYPFIDIEHGGSLKGMLNAANTLLRLVDASTKIIPGHGPMANKKDLTAYRDMLSMAYKRLNALKKDKKSLEQALATQPLKEFDASWSRGIFKTDQWIRLVYDGLD